MEPVEAISTRDFVRLGNNAFDRIGHNTDLASTQRLTVNRAGIRDTRLIPVWCSKGSHLEVNLCRRPPASQVVELRPNYYPLTRPELPIARGRRAADPNPQPEGIYADYLDCGSTQL